MPKVPHPFPYQGSKRSLAPAIAQYLPDDVRCFFEPFAGSAAMSLYAAANGKAQRYVIGDANNALMALWQAIIATPISLSEKYRLVWQGQFMADEGIYYDGIRSEFNRKHSPEHLLYLLARCVKAAVRYNSRGEFNQSRDKRRLGMSPEKMKGNIISASALLCGVAELSGQDYRKTLIRANYDDVVYMDPPYQGTSGERDRRYTQGLDYEAFVQSLHELNARSISYLVSYDGRTGEKRHGRMLPDKLELQRIELHAGKSSQATLLGRDAYTYESLYLSPALVARLAHKIPPAVSQQPLLHI